MFIPGISHVKCAWKYAHDPWQDTLSCWLPVAVPGLGGRGVPASPQKAEGSCGRKLGACQLVGAEDRHWAVR